MAKQWLIETVRACDRFQTDLRIGYRNGTHNIDVVRPVITTYQAGSVSPNFMSGSDEDIDAFLQQVLNAAWLRGLRPTISEYKEGQTELKRLYERLGTYL